MKKILIISSRYGGGHRSAAEAIGYGLKEWHDDCEVEYLDFGDIIGEYLNKFCTKSYDFSIKHTPFTHRILAAVTDSERFLRHANFLSSPILKSKLKKHLDRIKPDIVVNTFPAANHTIEKFKNKYNFKFITVITDLLSVHRYWLSPGTDKYLIAIPEMLPRLASLGLTEDKIEITGFVVRPDFFIEKNTHELKQKLNISENKFVITYLIGSSPEKFTMEMITQINALEDTELVVICGKNKKYEDKLNELNLKNVKVVGFTKHMDEYLRVCDVAIGKAGPGFVMEVATIGKPLIMTSYIAPQEQGNVELVLTKKWGYFAPGANLVLEKIQKIKSMDSEKYAEICQNALSTNLKNSTRNIVNFIANY